MEKFNSILSLSFYDIVGKNIYRVTILRAAGVFFFKKKKKWGEKKKRGDRCALSQRIFFFLYKCTHTTWSPNRAAGFFNIYNKKKSTGLDRPIAMLASLKIPLPSYLLISSSTKNRVSLYCNYYIVLEAFFPLTLFFFFLFKIIPHPFGATYPQTSVVILFLQRDNATSGKIPLDHFFFLSFIPFVRYVLVYTSCRGVHYAYLRALPTYLYKSGANAIIAAQRN